MLYFQQSWVSKHHRWVHVRMHLYQCQFIFESLDENSFPDYIPFERLCFSVYIFSPTNCIKLHSCTWATFLRLFSPYTSQTPILLLNPSLWTCLSIGFCTHYMIYSPAARSLKIGPLPCMTICPLHSTSLSCNWRTAVQAFFFNFTKHFYCLQNHCKYIFMFIINLG